MEKADPEIGLFLCLQKRKNAQFAKFIASTMYQSGRVVGFNLVIHDGEDIHGEEN